MNINKFLRTYGHKSFDEFPFNDVDALILSELSYVNLHLLTNDPVEGFILKKVSYKDLQRKDVYAGSVDARKNKKMLNLMARSRRYKNIIVRDIVSYFSEELFNQFYAITVILPNEEMFISYRGTDTSLIGWREDFSIIYDQDILAQRQGLDYLLNVVEKNNYRFRLGGHSKGGNIAFYCAFHLPVLYDKRFIHGYSFDGPGFREGILQFRNFRRVIKRLTKYLTYNDFIGSIYNNINNYKVVYSNGLLLGGHDPFYWKVNKHNGQFKTAYEISNRAKRINYKFKTWLDSLTQQEKLLAVDAIFKITRSCKTIYDLLKQLPKIIFSIRKSLSIYSTEDRTIVKRIYRRLLSLMLSRKRTNNFIQEKLRYRKEEIMVNNKMKQLKEKLETLRYYYHALSILSFDFETIAPKRAKQKESDVINYFSNEAFKIRNSDEMKILIQELEANKNKLEDPLDIVLVDKLYESYLKSKNITPELDLKLNEIMSKSYITWLEAKEKKDYKIFKPVFKEVVAVNEECINLRENKLPNLYDNYLNDCEKGLLQEELDPFFDELKVGLIDLLNRIKQSNHVIRRDFLSRKAPIYKQEQFSNYLLKLNGYDFDKGAVSTTEHPFTDSVSQYDARVTTHYYEDMVLSNMFSIIHEGGHAIFMQNERKIDHEHYINDYVSNGMHESVSRFYENIIGRSKEYIHLIYPKFIKIFNEEFGDISEEELYEAINIVEPSLVRTEADEVTYCLHIIIRYEMEKMICNKKLSLDDVSKMWNKLYKEYLGVDVPNDALGVLQDVHWTGGFGYFPSYAIGNCYNAMYLKKIKKDIPFTECVKKGDFETINRWMQEYVFFNANVLTPKEWIHEITGEYLTPKYYLEYLNNKYKDIYKL